MTRRKTGLPLDQHTALGLELAKIQDRINEAIEAVGSAYLSNGREVKALEKAGRAIEAARSVMDDAASRENSTVAASNAYYPAEHGRAGCARWSA